MEQWFQAKIKNFIESNNVEEKNDILTEIKIKLGNSSAGDLNWTACNINIGCLLALLTSIDREFIGDVCEILRTLFNASEPGAIYQKYATELSKLISHPNSAVRALVLQEILSVASNPQKQTLLLADIALLVAIVNKISDEDLIIAKSAMSILVKIGETTAGLNVLYSGELLRTLAKLVAKNDTVSFRVYEVIVDIAKGSKEGLQASAQSGFLNSLFEILYNDDVLLQLNAIEAMTSLVLTQEGLSYLEEQGILNYFICSMATVHENLITKRMTLSNLLICGIMKFFGNVARLWPNEFLSKYSIIVATLFAVIEIGDQNILGTALDTLGHVISKVEVKYEFHGVGDSMKNTLKKIAEIIQKMPTALKIRGLNNLMLILEVKKAERDNRILSLTKSWFDSLCEDPLGMITTLCKQPFADIRVASLQVLAVIASQAWGQEYISTYPGLIEFLLDRNVETFKECKEVKYKIIKNLSQAEKYIFDANTMQKFKQFVNEGPFYVEVNTEIAFEGAT